MRLEDGRQFELDEGGKLDAVLATGQHRVDVRIDDAWKSVTVDIADDDTMVVVDVDDPEPPNANLVGHVLGGRYRVEAVPGRGGMGVVYRATDIRLERKVAIKTLNEQLRANKEASALLLEEARQMASLSHPHLVAVHDVATHNDREVMVTELVEGTNLDDWIQQGDRLASMIRSSSPTR